MLLEFLEWEKFSSFICRNQKSLLFLLNCDCLPQKHTIYRYRRGCWQSWAIKQTFTNAFLILFLSVHFHIQFTAVFHTSHIYSHSIAFFHLLLLLTRAFFLNIKILSIFEELANMEIHRHSTPTAALCVPSFPMHKFLFDEKLGSWSFQYKFEYTQTHNIPQYQMYVESKEIQFDKLFCFQSIEICLNIQNFWININSIAHAFFFFSLFLCFCFSVYVDNNFGKISHLDWISVQFVYQYDSFTLSMCKYEYF